MALYDVVVSLLSGLAPTRWYSLSALSRSARILSLGVFLLIAFVGTVWSQDPQAGIMQFSTQVGGASESVDLASDSVFVKIPVRSKVGKIPFEFSLIMSTHCQIQSLLQHILGPRRI